MLCGLWFVSFAAAEEELQSTARREPETLQELFKQLDLFGAWASDCARAASPANPHVSITEPSEGVVVETHDIGPGYDANQYSVLSAQQMPGDRLQVDMLFQPGSQVEERQTLVFLIKGGTRRTLLNQPQGGEPRVKDGVVVGPGVKTPTLKKCG
jgi:hypothetical protein